MRYAPHCVFLLAFTAWAQTARHPKPADPKHFAVMAWGGSPADPDQLRGMRDSRAEHLRILQRAGSRAGSGGRPHLLCPRFLGSKAWIRCACLPTRDLRSRVADLARQVAANPAALGWYLRDEPNAQMMPGLGKIGEYVARSDAG